MVLVHSEKKSKLKRIPNKTKGKDSGIGVVMPTWLCCVLCVCGDSIGSVSVRRPSGIEREEEWALMRQPWCCVMCPAYPI